MDRVIKFFPRRFLKNHNATEKNLHSGCLAFFVFFLTTNAAFSGDAELTNLIVRNNNDEIQVDLLIKGIFTEEMTAAVSKGIPINITFLIFLYEVRDYWIDVKLVSKTAMHEVRFDVLRKEYRIRRSWEKKTALAVKDFQKAQSLFSEIQGFNVTALQRLKKGKHYQLRVKLEIDGKNFPFTGLPWEFETDWYTLNFIY